MTVERVSEHEAVTHRAEREDAVSVVRRALERAERGLPRFPGEEQGTRAAIRTLQERLRRLKMRGVEFGEVELSVYARQLAPGVGPMPLAS